MAKRVIKGSAKSTYTKIKVRIDLETDGLVNSEISNLVSEYADGLMDLLRKRHTTQNIKIEA